MRINKYVASASDLSRRKADEAVGQGRVTVNGRIATAGQEIGHSDAVMLDGHAITPAVETTIMLNKPLGYVCSRDGQGSKTIYDLLPPQYQHLQPVGRLDKDSSGLLLLTNDGNLANRLAHPSNQKLKIYEITLDKPLAERDRQAIEKGVPLEDGPSKLTVIPGATEKYTQDDTSLYEVKMHEGRNRQIRRTFAALGYKVTRLHRTQFGDYSLNGLAIGAVRRS